MICIHICYDNSFDLSQIQDELMLYMKTNNVSFKIDSFLNPEKLIYELQDNKIADIYILDVSMSYKNGFELAEEIRKYTQKSIIIFLTSMEHQASLGYKVKAFRYIAKINMRSELQEAIKDAVYEINTDASKVLTVRHYNDFWRVPYSDIISVSKISRQLQIETVSFGTLTDNRGIKELYNLLDDDNFLFIDRGSFINIDYIKQISGNIITLKNGKFLPISRRTVQSFKQELLNRWN